MSDSTPQAPNRAADQIMAVEVFSQVLAATDASQLGEKLTEQLRELTGARTVMVITHEDEPHTHALLHACPIRRTSLFSAADLDLLCPTNSPELIPSRVADFPPNHPLRALLLRVGIESLLRIPLHAGSRLVGMLLLLDLPALERIDEMNKIVTHLSPVLALALRNALAHRRIGQQAQQLDVQTHELEQRVAERTAALQQEIAERTRTEKIMHARLRLLKFADSHTMDELLTATLDEIEVLTGSTIGFYHFVEVDEQTLILHSWSTNTINNMCTAEGTGSHYDVDQAGVWADCVRERRPLIHNDYASLEGRKGMPEGHATVVREVVVPIFRGEQIVAIVGIGNKPTNYVETDIEIVSQLGDLSWDVADRMRVQGEIHQLNQQLEQRVADRTEQLEAANKELEAFSYSVSHDLRAPLRAIDGFSLILLEEYAEVLDEEGRRLLNVVRDNTVRMRQLIDDILKFSRTGRLEISFSEVNMEKMAHAVCTELLPPESNSKLQWEIEPIPPARGDSSMLRQVFVNLLANAIKFSRNQETPHIKVGAHMEENETVYYVKDNGVGFDMRYVDKLFGVFQRLHSVDEFEGTGIGLAIVKRIISRHGGRVWAESKVNEGTTIYFVLPRGKANEA